MRLCRMHNVEFNIMTVIEFQAPSNNTNDDQKERHVSLCNNHAIKPSGTDCFLS